MRPVHFPAILFLAVIVSGFFVLIPGAQAEVFSPDECKAILGTCKRSTFGSNCSGDETEVAKCNVGGQSCCKIVRDSSGTILSGEAALAEFRRDMDSGAYTTVLDAVPIKSGDETVASGPLSDDVSTGDGGGDGGGGDGGGGTAAAANLNYTLLEKIPGQESATGNLPGYVQAILNAALMIIVLSAIFMISVGGFLYLTSAGNTSRAGQARGIITDAILGLILALVSYLILYIINPDLVTLRISSLSPSGGSGGTSSSAGTTSSSSSSSTTGASSGDTYTHEEAEAALSAKGIKVTSTGRCSDPSIPTCTSLAGIPKSTIEDVITLKEKSGCSFNVTGGTETGHSAHGPGKPVVDVNESSCLEDKFRNQRSSLESQYNIKQICSDSNSREAAYNCSFIEAKPHFHLKFSS